MKHFIQSLLGFAGYQISKKNSAPSNVESPLTSFLLAAKKLGFKPALAYDVGANRGVWAKEFLAVFPETEIVLFEPQRHLSQALCLFAEDYPKACYRSCALSASVGKASFFSSPWDVTSRLAEPSGSQSDVNQFYQVDVSTLDEQSLADGRCPDLIKIDVEGEELKVLSGGAEILTNVSVVILEVGICCDTTATTSLAVTSRMSELGYDLMGIVNLNPYQTPSGSYASGVIWHADFAFVNRSSFLCEALKSNPAVCVDSVYG